MTWPFKKTSYSALAFAFFAVIGLGFCLHSSVWALCKPGTELPSIGLPDLDGNQYDISRLTDGKVGLIVYWSVSCPHCRVELPHLLRLARRLEGNPFKMVLVNADGPAMLPAAKAYAQDFGMPEPILLDSGPKDSMPLGEALDIIATPTVLVVNPKGVIVHAQELKVDMDKLQKAVKASF